MSLDHLSEEGLTEFEVPFSIFLFHSPDFTTCDSFQQTFSYLWTTSQAFSQDTGIQTTVYDVIFFWYTILHFNHNIKHKEKSSNST